jgi:Domain of unknown function (DUF3473)/Polysaccharide deacetylase
VTTGLCLTVDVEDFYEGMGVLGHRVERPPNTRSDLAGLLGWLEAQTTAPRVTVFAVAGYAPQVRSALEEFVAAGHEVASHGPDHGRLSSEDTVGWLRRGKEALEDLLSVPVRGFRSPRFDLPDRTALSCYRDQLARAGYEYVSDTHLLGASSPVGELPVLRWGRLPIGGGSYHRVLPLGVVANAIERCPGKAVLYYHSYDFDGSLPPLREVRTLALAEQVVGRRRVANTFRRLCQRFGSETCLDARR